MRIVIVGAGRIGFKLANMLSMEKHEVYVLEEKADVALKADEKLDAKVICGSGSDPKTLKQVQIDKADLVIAVTYSDETNLVVCSLADFYGAKRQIARIRNAELSRELGVSGYKHFNIDEVINPEELAGRAVISAVQAPGSKDIGDFANGRILLRSFDIPDNSPLVGSQVGDLREEDFPWPFLIIALVRQNEVIIPKGDTLLQRGDLIYVMLPSESLPEFLNFVDPNLRRPLRVLIYGATDTAEIIIKELSAHIKDIILVEEDAQKAEDAAADLPEARVINGSPSEKEILQECGIEAVDVFISTTTDDHANLINAVLAKRMGAKRTIILTQQLDFVSIADSLDIDVIISPHLLAIDQILSYVRGRGVESVTKLMGCDAEALEFICENDAPITKAPLRDQVFPHNSIVGAVVSGDSVVLAKGDTKLQPGDKAIVFCQKNCAPKLQKLFGHKGSNR
jgi:trk system potassium uptake protein TrkA